MPERIQLRRTKGWRKPEGAVSVARPSPFGNPFTLADAIEAGYDYPRRACVSHFTAWIEGHENYQDVYVVASRRYDRRWIREHLADLAGKDLCCWCKPGDPCHGEVLLELANGEDDQDPRACIGCPGCHTGGRCIDDDDPDTDRECPGCGELNGDCAPACPYADDPDEDYAPVTLRPVVDVPTGDLL